MTLRDILNKFKITAKVGVKTSFLDLTIEYNDVDRAAAWDLYIELITRVTTQELRPNEGDANEALKSIYGIFDLTRSTLHKNGPRCQGFAQVSILILNKVIRPFTAKWHKISLDNGLADQNTQNLFIEELNLMHINIKKYISILSEIAGLGPDFMEEID